MASRFTRFNVDPAPEPLYPVDASTLQKSIQVMGRLDRQVR